jgi:hypothetical protein
MLCVSWPRLLFCKQIQDLRRKPTGVEVHRVNLFNVRAWLAQGGRKGQSVSHAGRQLDLNAAADTLDHNTATDTLN